MSTLVSVCIPTYNNEEYIGRTIESILKQTHQKWELIIVDDCSKDRTVEIIEQYEDSRIHLFRNEKNLGMAGNWNRCVELASGEYIKFICADDILMAECLETELKIFLEHPSLSMVVSDSRLINDQGVPSGVFPRYPRGGIQDGKKVAKRSLIFINYFGMPCAVMFRKELFAQIGGFSKEFHYIVDFDLWLAMSLYGDVYVNKQFLNCFRLREDSNSGAVFSKKQREYYAEHKKALRKYKKVVGINRAEYIVSLCSRWLRNWANGVYIKIALNKYKQ